MIIHSPEPRDTTKKLMIGAIELVSLPDFEINMISARIDTGAQTSSLHATNIQEIDKHGCVSLCFNTVTGVKVQSKIHDIRYVRSSNGSRQKRYVVETTLKMGNRKWPFELTLSDRSDMTFDMLLGREAMIGRVIVDPEHNYLLSS